jgi:GMP synthase-like glutamine amidotransferase
VINRGTPALGICLGGQLISDVFGGHVTRNYQKEIGWFPVSITEVGEQSPLFRGFPPKFMTFHWHGDMFSIPKGANHLAWSSICRNQAFQYGKRVLGLQFHLDFSIDSVEKMITNCSNELVDTPYIQKPAEMLRSHGDFIETRSMLYKLLYSMHNSISI